jgi:hypothetical protein
MGRAGPDQAGVGRVNQPRWYVAILLFRFEVKRTGTAPDEPRVQHEMRLILAQDDEAAYERAMFLGRGQEREYQNARDELVHYRFLGLHDLGSLDHIDPKTGALIKVTPEDGAVLYRFRLPRDQAWRVLPKQELTPFLDVEKNLEAWHRLLEEEDARSFTGPKLVDDPPEPEP